MTDAQTVEIWNKVAGLYESKFMDIDVYNDTYDQFCELIPDPGVSVFEIGCGPGNITRYLLNKRPDLKIQAIDISPEMIELAKKNNPAAEFRAMDCRDIDKLTLKFDAIICGFCIPYLSQEEVVKLISDCHQLLKNDGIFYLSAIEGAYSKSGYETGSSGDKLYVHYYEEQYLSGQLQEAGFQIEQVTRRHLSPGAEQQPAHLIFLCKKTI